MFCTHFSVTALALIAGYSPDFGPPSLFPTGAYGPMKKGDFNGDGRMDLVLSANGRLRVLLGRGDGTFASAIDSPARDIAYSDVVVADFNGDGRLDVAGVGSDFAVIQFGVGDGTFRAPEGALPPNNAQDPNSFWTLGAAGDVNGDGAIDLAIIRFVTIWWGEDGAATNASELWIFRNRGDGTFDFNEASYIGYWDSPSGITSIELIDYDRDGAMDVVIGDQQSGNISFRGYGIGSFSGPWSEPILDYQTSGVVVGDFNGDGNLDLMMGPGYYGWFQPLFGRGNGAFDAGPTFPSNGRRTPGAADFNGDGNLDVICSDSSNYGVVEVLLGFGRGAFGLPKEFRTEGSSYTRALVIHDFNGDGLPDAAAAIGPNVCVLLNDGVWKNVAPQPSVSISNCTVNEGDSGTTNAEFIVKLSTASPLPVTVRYSTGPGTVTPSATPGVDYVTTTGTLTFAPLETTKSIFVPVIGDLVTEPIYEYFVVDLSAPTNAVIANGQGLCAIFSEERPPVIAISNVSKKEGQNGNTQFNFQVTLSAPIYETVTVKFRTADGTATIADRDYAAANGTLTFSPGQRTKTITVTVMGDRKREADETFYVDLYDPSSNATIGQGRGTGTILNDD